MPADSPGYFLPFLGADGGDRTRCLHDGNVALYPMSYNRIEGILAGFSRSSQPSPARAKSSTLDH